MNSQSATEGNELCVPHCEINFENETGNKVTFMANAPPNHNICVDKKMSPDVSTRVHQKCWKGWQLSVKCSCLQHVHTEERKTRQGKIHDFIEVLRRHKQLSQIKSQTNDFKTSVRVNKNPVIPKRKCTDRIIKSKQKPIALETQKNLMETDRKETSSNNCSSHSSVFKKSKENVVENSPNLRRNHEEIRSKQTFSVYHRYEAQQKIIACQKMQLLHQEKIINNFILENLNNQSKQSASKTLHEMHTYNLKLKRCRQKEKHNSLCIEKNFFEHTEPTSSQLKCDYLRNEKWRRLMKERKERKEREKLQKNTAELRKRKQLEEEGKLKIFLEVEEKRRQKVKMDKERKEAKEKLKRAMDLATEHYNKKIFQKYGIEALKNYVATEKERVLLMTDYYKRKLLVKHFYEWHRYVRDFGEEKMVIAASFYYVHLIRRCFKSFSKNVQGNMQNEQVADDFYCMKLTEVIFHKWHLHSYREQMERNSISKQAVSLYNRKLKMNALNAWTRLPAIVKEDREREKRKEFWRQKVREILPDFFPTLKGGH